MILEYDIPNGTMTIEADIFFLGADKSKIRKMLKEYIRSGQAYNDLLPRWFQQECDALEQHAADICKKYIAIRTCLSETEQLYQQMRDPCYAVYTKDKEELKTIKGSIAVMKKRLRVMNDQIKDCKKSMARYRWCTELIESLERTGSE